MIGNAQSAFRNRVVGSGAASRQAWAPIALALAILVAASTVSTPVRAQAGPGGISAAEVLTRSAAAYSAMQIFEGREIGAGLSDLGIPWTFEVSTEFRAPDELKIQMINSLGNHLAFIRDGLDAYMIDKSQQGSDVGKQVLDSHDEFLASLRGASGGGFDGMADLVAPLLGRFAKTDPLASWGVANASVTESVERSGPPCFVVSGVRHGSLVRLWFDKRTFLLRRAESRKGNRWTAARFAVRQSGAPKNPGKTLRQMQ